MKIAIFVTLLWLAFTPPAHAQIHVEPFVRNDAFKDIQISPTGEYLAATVPRDDRTGAVVMRRADLKVTASFALGKNTHIDRIWWANDDRLLISMAEKFGSLDKPLPTGELYAVNADGRGIDILVGQRVQSAGPGTRLPSKQEEQVAAYVVDVLPEDDKSVIVAIWPFDQTPYTRAERLDVYSGRRSQLARAPVQRASFSTDRHGEIRFAYGSGSDNSNKLYYREGKNAEWRLINDEAANGRREWPLGFSADNKLAYLQSEQPQGPDAIISYDPVTGERMTLLRDKRVDPAMILYKIDGITPIGASYKGGDRKTAFFDEASADARLYRSLEATFEGQNVYITSRTKDGKLALVEVASGNNPGDFYVFDIQAGKADYLLSRGDWLDPDKMATVKPFSLAARDGMELHGFLTVPHGTSGKQMPMVVLPHGGPFGEYDAPDFNNETQLLASAGFLVLQVNFRGSGNYGRAFQVAGAREWGGKMQDDLTDATRWAISEGIADPGRICLYGASYGAYAALMGAATVPGLYRCAAGYVGVYDLPLMSATDRRISKSMANFSDEWIGPANTLAAISPTALAERIKVPVFLAAGGEDKVAPIEHTRRMEAALKKAGVPVEAVYYPNEGHGFYVPANRAEFYGKLVAFLSRNLASPDAGNGGKAVETSAN